MNIETITPQWLSAVLRQRGALAQGRVTEVITENVQTGFASAVGWLSVNYSADAAPVGPKKLFLKQTCPTLAPGTFDPQQLPQEAIFYGVIARAMPRDFVIPCYDTAYDPQTGASHILLEDVSETHHSGGSPADLKNCQRAVDTLARLHAFWWDHARLGKEFGRLPTLAERQQEWRDAENSTTRFMAALGTTLRPAWRGIYERVLPALPHLYQRYAAGRNLTLVHGDAHLGNFLFPKDDASQPTYLIDWQFWHCSINGTDLAFMMAAEWEIETRRRWELPLLQRYYQQLVTLGVQGYTWQQCWDDYRLSVILVSIFIPVWRWAIFHWDPDLPALEKGMTAFEDLHCLDLLP